MSRTRALLIALLIVSAGVCYYQYDQRQKDELVTRQYNEKQRLMALGERRRPTSTTVFPAKPPFFDSLYQTNFSGQDSVLSTNTPPPIPAWQTKEKVFYQDILANGRFDTLVVPFQVQGDALDRATRSLMTAQLAQVIAEAGRHPLIPDPYLVARALGESDRRLDPFEVYRLAARLGVKQIVWGYVGHNQNYRMSLTIQRQNRPASGSWTDTNVEPPEQKDFSLVLFSDENPPIEVYQSLLPEILKAFGMDGNGFSAQKPYSRLETAVLPPTPKGITQEKVEPSRDAYYLQLLAAWTPHRADRTRERLVEKSLLAIFSMSPDSPEYRLLKTRAFLLLGLRSAALKVLGEPRNAEEKELYAALNGNLPDVESFSNQIQGEVKALLAKSDENVISVAYGLRNQAKLLDAAKALPLPGKIWPYLAMRAFTDSDWWAQHHNIGLKILLDQEFPIADFTAEGLLRGVAALGDDKKLETISELSVISHIHKLIQMEPKKWCCRQDGLARFTEKDYLDFVEGIATDNLVRRALLLSMAQGLPEQSLEFLEAMETEYKGHPHFVLARAEADVRKAQKLDGNAKQALLDSARNELNQAIYWEQGQTQISALAIHLASSMRDWGDLTHKFVDTLFENDYPFHLFFPARDQHTNKRKALAAMANSAWDFFAVSSAYDVIANPDSPSSSDAFIRSIENRFTGSPERADFLATISLKKGDAKAAEAFWREGIQRQPSSWHLYNQLGTFLFENGKDDEAAEIFMRYPGLQKDSGENAVGLSIDTSTAGSLFYWTGNFEKARPLFKISAELDTGSSAGMISELYLRLMDGDYAGALQAALSRARRYDQARAYRDYLQLMHVMGHSQEAWDAFRLLSEHLDKPQILESALVGHRLAGASEADIAAWVQQNRHRNADDTRSHAAMYLLRSSVTDHTPTQKLGARIEEIEPPTAVASANASVAGEPSVKLKSDLVAFAESYRALRKGDFATAQAVLLEAADHFDVRLNEYGYLLPYHAFAAAQSGNTAGVEKLLNGFQPESQRFDYHLSRAVISAFAGKTDESLQHLKLALHRLPFNVNRPLYAEYQYAELCEWLYEATGKEPFHDLALDWAKKNQVFLPWDAWPYAMEAKLTRNEQDRRRAMAMAYYLDPNSERLAALPKSEVKAAVKAFGKLNPFLKAVGQRKMSST